MNALHAPASEAAGWTRSDLRLLRKAVRENWPIAPERRERIVREVTALALGPGVPTWLQIAATETLLEMERANLASDFPPTQKATDGRESGG